MKAEKKFSACEYNASFTITTPASNRKNKNLQTLKATDDTDVEEDEDFLHFSDVTVDISDQHNQKARKNGKLWNLKTLTLMVQGRVATNSEYGMNTEYIRF